MNVLRPLFYCLLITSIIQTQEPDEQQKLPKKKLLRSFPNTRRTGEISQRLISFSPILTNVLEAAKEKEPVIEFLITREANTILKSLYPALESKDEYALDKAMMGLSPEILSQLYNIGEYYEIPLLAQYGEEEYIRSLTTYQWLQKFADTYKSTEEERDTPYNPHEIIHLNKMRTAFNSYIGQYGDAKKIASNVKNTATHIFVDNDTFAFSDEKEKRKNYTFSTDAITNRTHVPEAVWRDTVIHTYSSGFDVHYKNIKVYESKQTFKDAKMSLDGSVALLSTYDNEMPLLLNCTTGKSSEITFNPTGLDHEIVHATLSKSNRLLALKDITGTIYIYDTKTCTLLNILNNNTPGPFTFTNDETALVIVNKDTLCLYNIEQKTNSTRALGASIELLSSDAPVVMHPDNKHLLVKTTDQQITAYDMSTGSTVCNYTTTDKNRITHWETSADRNYLIIHHAQKRHHSITCFDIRATNSSPFWEKKFSVPQSEYPGKFVSSINPVHNTMQIYQFINTLPVQTIFSRALPWAVIPPKPIRTMSPEHSLLIDLKTGDTINAPFAHLNTLHINDCQPNPDRTSLIIIDDKRNLHRVDCNQWSFPQTLAIVMLRYNKNNPDKRIKFAHNPATIALIKSLPESIQKLYHKQLPQQPPQEQSPWWHAISIAPQIGNLTSW